MVVGRNHGAAELGHCGNRPFAMSRKGRGIFAINKGWGGWVGGVWVHSLSLPLSEFMQNNSRQNICHHINNKYWQTRTY